MKYLAVLIAFVSFCACGGAAKAQDDVAEFIMASLSGASSETALAPEDQEANELRFRLAQVNLYSETGNLDKAFDLIEALKRDYPLNPRVLAAEAQLNNRIGNYGGAFLGLNKATLLDPFDEDILEQRRAAAAWQGPAIMGGYTYRRTDPAYEQLARASGQFPLTPSMGMRLSLENDHMHTRTPILRQNGESRHFRGDRQRGAVVLNKVFESNHDLSAAIYANNATAGAGLEHGWWDARGSTKLRGEFNRPYWDYIETVIEDGTKSDIHLERKQIFSKDVVGAFGGGYNHYALDGVWDAADALAWNAALEYALPLSFFERTENEINLSASYTADAEYFTFVKRRGPAGGRYKPLSASDYEVHAGTFSIGKTFFSDLLLQGYGGYSYNRLNDNGGPLYGVSLGYSLSDKLNVEFRASHTDSGGENNAQSEDQLGLNLKWVL